MLAHLSNPTENLNSQRHWGRSQRSVRGLSGILCLCGHRLHSSLSTRMNNELNFPPKRQGARSRLYRRRFLQVNSRWKALAEIYTMHSFAPFFNLRISAKNRQHFFAIEKLNFRFLINNFRSIIQCDSILFNRSNGQIHLRSFVHLGCCLEKLPTWQGWGRKHAFDATLVFAQLAFLVKLNKMKLNSAGYLPQIRPLQRFSKYHSVSPSPPELKGSIGEGPNPSNYSDQSSVRILSEVRRFC